MLSTEERRMEPTSNAQRCKKYRDRTKEIYKKKMTPFAKNVID